MSLFTLQFYTKLLYYFIPYRHRYATSSEEGQFAELEEAQKTTYVQGQWVITGSPMDEIQYAVVEPFIPSSGDYSAYMSWCKSGFKIVSAQILKCT